MSNNNNGQRGRFCSDCSQALHPGHSRTCPGRQQGAIGQQQQRGAGGPDYDGQIRALVRRIQTLETLGSGGSTLDRLQVAHPRQPQGTVNRVFTCPVATVSAGPHTTNWARVGELDVNDQMAGFAAWAAPYVRVSITAVLVTYTPNVAAIQNAGVVGLGFAVASIGQGSPTNFVAMDRKAMGQMVSGPFEVHAAYEVRTPFERWLKGPPAAHALREHGRVFVLRSARQIPVATGQAAYTGDVGFVHVHVQCACLRPAN